MTRKRKMDERKRKPCVQSEMRSVMSETNFFDVAYCILLRLFSIRILILGFLVFIPSITIWIDYNTFHMVYGSYNTYHRSILTLSILTYRSYVYTVLYVIYHSMNHIGGHTVTLL
jgi:hypothetical protein